MACTCENINCTQTTVDEIVYCTCSTIVPAIVCPDGCSVIIVEGEAICSCVEQIAPTIVENKTSIYFDNENYFKDVSWTISYNASQGGWGSFFSFYPDYSIAHNGFFQIGYNFGQHKETAWNHLLKRNSFCVFQGELHVPVIEFPIPNENTYKMLNSISLNIEAVHYVNDWDTTTDKNKSFKNLFIFNQTNCSGLLGLNPQTTLSDNRKYPKMNGNIQEILFTTDEYKQNINYFFNRKISESNNLPIFITDENNIFKTINKDAVKFSGKKVLERLKGDWFTIHLEGNEDSRFNLILKNTINNITDI